MRHEQSAVHVVTLMFLATQQQLLSSCTSASAVIYFRFRLLFKWFKWPFE